MPNISYASEKLRNAIESLHLAHAEASQLRSVLPSQFVHEVGPPVYPPSCQAVQRHLQLGFTELLVGLAEIHGMLDVVGRNESAIVTKLLDLRHDDFKEWLDRFEHNGELSCDQWPLWHEPIKRARSDAGSA